MDKRTRSIVTFIGVVLFLGVMKLCSSLFMPLVISLFIFILVSPVMDRLEKCHVPSIIAMILVILIVAFICIIFVYLLFAMINMVLAKLRSEEHTSELQSPDHLV